MKQRTTTGAWGSGNLICECCAAVLPTKWIQKITDGSPAPHLTARHSRCICQASKPALELDKIKRSIADLLKRCTG